MKLTKKLEAEVRHLYETYWNSYINGDLKTYASLLDDDFKFIGSTEGEPLLNKKESIKFLEATADQLAGKAEFRNRIIKVELIDDLILITELSDGYILIETEWVFYSRFRLSSLLQKKEEGWKFIHQHVSMPDSKAQEGESFGLEQIRTENIQLRDAVKRRTVELEHKNRELEIEAALERVRAVAMSMMKSDALMSVCEILLTELKMLGFTDTRLAQIFIFNDAKESILNYQFSDYGVKGITEINNNSHPVIKKLADEMRKAKEAFMEVELHGNELEEWKNWRINVGQLRDSKLDEATSIYYYWYSIGAGAIGISTFKGIAEEQMKILDRFRNVFGLAYRRYTDITQAEAQAIESQIQLALERVRARTMAMQRSDELKDAANLLFRQVKGLGIHAWSAGYGTWTEDKKACTLWMSSEDVMQQPFNCPHTEDPVFIRFAEAAQKGETLYVEEMGGEELKSHYRYMRKLPLVGEMLEDILKAGFDVPTFQIFHVAYFSYGYLLFITYEPVPEAWDIFKRFASVFEQTYTRFLDLQKAEAQAREAKIEAALERTRTQSMIMQHSKELDDTLRVFHEQVLLLGINSAFSFLWLPDEEKDRHIFWAAWGEDKNDSTVFKSKAINYPLDRNEPATAQCLVDWKSNEPVYSYHVPPAVVENYFAAWQELIDGVEQLKPEYFSDGLYYVEAFMKYGCFGVMVATDLTEDEKKILGRFAIEFERTYTRFLDLQKAEAQAREAQIEAALEKVRSRSLAMHKSDELSEVVAVVFEKLLELDFSIDGAAFIITYIEDSKDSNVWLAGNNQLYPTCFRLPYNEAPPIKDFWLAKESGVDFFSRTYSFEEKNHWFKYAFEHTDFKNLAGELKNWILEQEFLTQTAALGKNSIIGIHFHHQKLLSEKEVEILKRFSKVFDQAYIRFLDLQKAEAQARESQIEAALERVRSRSMGMQKSEELKEVIQVVYEQFVHLNIKIEHTGFVIDYKARDDYDIWIADPLGVPSQVTVPYFDSVYYNRFNEAKEKGMDFFATNLTFEEKNRFYQKLFEYVPGLPEQAKEFYFSCPGLAISTVLLENVCLYIENFSGISYSDEENNTLMRFGKVFQQTYTRFLDLQKAEVQARELQIELGLERVRARAMAMQESDELAELVDTVFKELTKLDFALTWCMINIIDESSLSNTVWTINSESGKIPESFHMKFEDYPFHHAMMKGWKDRKTKYVYVLEGLEKKVYDEYLFNETEFKKVPEAAQIASRAIEKYVCSFSFSNFGGLQTVGDAPLSDANLDILSRFGKVFDLTYTRFNDLKLAEAQAREAQIEAGLERVRSRAMAMHKTDELLDAAELVYKELSALGITSMNISYAFVDEEEKYASYYSVNPVDGKTLPFPFVFPHTETEVMRSILSSWKKQEPFNVIELDEEATLKHQTYIGEHIQKLITKKNIDIPFSVEAFLAVSPKKAVIYSFNFTKGYLFNIGGVRLTKMQEEMVLRFTKVFEMTYRRFLDLKQAEAQAREAQIELALERVRARTMAMQRSEELQDAALLLFKQVQALGVPSFACGFNIWDEDRKAATAWMAREDALQPPFKTSSSEDVFLRIYEAEQRGESLFVAEQAGEELETHYRYMASIPVFRDVMEKMSKAGLSVPSFQIIHCAFFSQGYLMFISYERVSESWDIFKRFAKVFEQTYTRFLDLQKAEAQAREATVEAALERVRARAMAMHNSDDVSTATATMFTELEKLGIENFRVGITNIRMDQTQEVWSVNNVDDGKIVRAVGIFDMNIHPFWRFLYKRWEQKEEFLHYYLTGKEKEDYVKILNKTPNYLSQPIKQFPDMNIQCYYFAEGAVWTFSLKPHTEDEKQVMKKFTSVFSITFRRYQDLKKAEAQAREATIEAALERVRAKAMAMHNSNDLTATASLVFTELRKLGISPIRCGVGILNKENRKALLYSATASDEEDSLSLVGWVLLDVNPVLKSVYDSWIRGEDYFPVLKKEMLKSYYEHLKLGFEVPDEHAAYEQHGYFLSFSEGSFYGWSEKPFDEAEIKILKRFASVIDLTFRRYMELQKSEVNAREAVKQAALDRVRAEIASMRTVADLERITPLIWNELTILGVPFIRCGVFIMDDEHELIHTFLSTPDGKAIAAFHIPYTTPGNIAQVLSHWHHKKIYTDHWDEAAFTEFAGTLVKQGVLASPEQYLKTLPHGGFYLHFLPFLQGMLYVGNTTQLGENEIKLLQSIADAFSTAYARYEDFNKLEAAKKQVDGALNELQATQKQLIQSEKMASLGELTAGIAHEIQNPLNFVNNFSEVSTELLDEMITELGNDNKEDAIAIADDVKQNLEKILHHGKRADGIVKGMLQHSRTSSGQKVLTDINALADEYLRLAYHGLRAKDKSFSAVMNTDFDESLSALPTGQAGDEAGIGKISVVPQDIGRVLLNLINNAFYSAMEKKKHLNPGENYEPTVSVSTKKISPLPGGLRGAEIHVKDNGLGIPQKVMDKIFQPFFTTKPTGQGTGLGLSLSYDIIKAHGGEIKVNTKEGEGAEFIIYLP